MSNLSTDKLADFITSLSFSELPEEVIKKAKYWMLDAIGCGLGGSQTELGKTAINSLSQTTSGNASVVGSDVSVDLGTGAFLNAMCINALDYDDCDPAGHLSSTLVGTLLALCSHQPETKGSDLLLSYIVGYEVNSRVGQATFPSEERFEEVWGLGTRSVIGDKAAAAKFRTPDKEQPLNAMGIAGASAPVPSAQKWGWDHRPLTWMKDAVALPAQLGIMSTTLAEAGFAGCRDILDGPTGFWRMAGSDRCDFDLMTRNLGTEFFILNNSVKMYACCWFIHPTLDAVQEIVKEHGLTHQDIDSIDVWSLTDLDRFFNFTEPKRMVDV